jgi:hypothetical protein
MNSENYLIQPDFVAVAIERTKTHCLGFLEFKILTKFLTSDWFIKSTNEKGSIL